MDIAIEGVRLVQKGNGPDAAAVDLGGGRTKACWRVFVRQHGLDVESEISRNSPSAGDSSVVNCCDIGVAGHARDVFLDFLNFPTNSRKYIFMGKRSSARGWKAIGHYFSGDALAYFEPKRSAQPVETDVAPVSRQGTAPLDCLRSEGGVCAHRVGGHEEAIPGNDGRASRAWNNPSARAGAG